MLELNTLGDPASRKAYREVLVEYFSGHRDQLSEDSQARLTRNPLRILDSKDKGDRRVSAGAPALSDYLNQESVDFFAKVKEEMEALGIAYELNSRIWSAASTTTPTPSSSSPRPSWVPRTASWAAAATTG